VRTIAVILKKELWSYCCSPVSYLIGVLFYLWRGFEVFGLAAGFQYAKPDQDLFASFYYQLSSTYVMAILVPPILTMRCFAEERRTGSLETLMTAPVRDFEVVLGKWLAAVAFYALLWLPTVVILWLLTLSPLMGATQFAFAPVATAYFGLFLLSALFMSIGCFTSSLTDNVLLAVLAAIIMCFGLLKLPEIVGPYVVRQLDRPWVAELFEKISVESHFATWFARGLVDTSQVAFYLGGTAFFLFLCTQCLAARRLQ
jgi:ABC-2 type transport system permease protein